MKSPIGSSGETVVSPSLDKESIMDSLAARISRNDARAKAISTEIDGLFSSLEPEVVFPRSSSAGELVSAALKMPHSGQLNSTKRAASKLISKRCEEVDAETGRIATLCRALDEAAEHLLHGRFISEQGRKALGEDVLGHVRETRLGLLAGVVSQGQVEGIADRFRIAHRSGLKALGDGAMRWRRARSVAKTAQLRGEHRYLLEQAKRLDGGGYAANPLALVAKFELVSKRMQQHTSAYRKTFLAGSNYTPSKKARRPRV
jgi:hypothetical protein